MVEVQERLRQAWASGERLTLDTRLDGAVPAADADLPQMEGAWLLDLLTRDGGHPRGLRLQGARIIGDLDWSWHKLTTPLWLVSCILDTDLDLSYVSAPGLQATNCRGAAIRAHRIVIDHDLGFRGSHITGLGADGAQVTGSVFLTEGFTSTGEVRLLGASIGGQLALSGAKLANPDGATLHADGAQITGSVFLTEGFTSTGEIRLLGASIGGQLNLLGATVTNPNSDTLNAYGARITGGVFLTEGFISEGEVRLVDARIGGQLNLSGAKLINPDGVTLSADQAQITGSVFLTEGFTSEGEIRLPGASIDGQLNLLGATVANPCGVTLHADGAQITGGVFLREGFTSSGTIRLPGASIGSDIDLRKAALSQPNGRALELEGAQVAGCLWMQQASQPVEGVIDLTRVQVCELGDAPDFWPTKGKLILSGLVYDRLGEGSPTDPGQRLDWIRRNQAYSPQPYRQLARVLEATEYPDAARTIRIAARDDHRRLGGLRIHQRSWNRFLSWTIGHGYLPARPVWRLLLPLYVLTVVFIWVAGAAGMFIPTGDSVPQDPVTGHTSITSTHCTPDYPCLIPAAYAAENLIPVLDLRQASLWQPDAHTYRGQALRWWLYATTGVGWISTSLILAALTGLTEHKD